MILRLCQRPGQATNIGNIKGYLITRSQLFHQLWQGFSRRTHRIDQLLTGLQALFKNPIQQALEVPGKLSNL